MDGMLVWVWKKTLSSFVLDELIRISPLLQREVHILLVVHGMFGSFIQKQSSIGVLDLYCLDLFEGFGSNWCFFKGPKFQPFTLEKKFL